MVVHPAVHFGREPSVRCRSTQGGVRERALISDLTGTESPYALDTGVPQADPPTRQSIGWLKERTVASSSWAPPDQAYRSGRWRPDHQDNAGDERHQGPVDDEHHEHSALGCVPAGRHPSALAGHQKSRSDGLPFDVLRAISPGSTCVAALPSLPTTPPTSAL